MASETNRVFSIFFQIYSMTDFSSNLIQTFGIVGFVFFLVFFSFKIFGKNTSDSKQATDKQNTITPLRLQAYERMVLFLERIKPNNLLLRIGNTDLQSIDFQRILLQEIREEYNHNLAQQIYMSQESWEKVQASMQEVMVLINTAASEIPQDSSALNLSKKIFEKMLSEGKEPCHDAILFLKKELQNDLF